MADHGAFTDDQLRRLKREGRSRAAEVRGRFNWMRQDLLAVVGGKFFYRQRVIFELSGVPCIWFDRDDENSLLLSFVMPTITGRPRARIDQNFWSVAPAVREVMCPPNGRLIEVNYGNGNKFRVEFFNVSTSDALHDRYPVSSTRDWSDDVRFPVTVVELWETAAGTDIQFGPDFSTLGNGQMKNCYASNNGGAAVHLDLRPGQLSSLLPEPSVSSS